MTDAARTRLTALVAHWREKASQEGAIYAQGIEECAAELEALLDVLITEPQEKQDDQTRVEPSVPCVETTRSTAEQSPGVVTAAERTDEDEPVAPFTFGDDLVLWCEALRVYGTGPTLEAAIDDFRASVHELRESLEAETDATLSVGAQDLRNILRVVAEVPPPAPRLPEAP